MNAFAECLLRYRKENKVTQREFAERIGVKSKIISLIEEEVDLPSTETIKKLAVFFEWTLTDIGEMVLNTRKKRRVEDVGGDET